MDPEKAVVGLSDKEGSQLVDLYLLGGSGYFVIHHESMSVAMTHI